MRSWITLFIGIWSAILYAYPLEMSKLEKEITSLSKVGAFEEAIEKLQWVVLDAKASSEHKAEAYFLKHEIYSKLGLFTEAENNLNLFLSEGKTLRGQVKVYSVRVKLAQAILSCKKGEYDEKEIEWEEISAYSTHFSSREFALYLFLEGIREREKGEYTKASDDFETAITLLKGEESDYLPVVYNELISLYGLMENPKKVIGSYQEGVTYAKEYNVLATVFELHRTLSDYYKSLGKHEESLALSATILQMAGAYNIPSISSRLDFVEKDILKRSKEMEQQKNKRIQRILLGFILLVCFLVGISFVAYQKNKERKTLMERENFSLKSSYTSLKEEKKNAKEPQLTERQLTILNLVKMGKTNKEIAEDLCISENTVKYHLKIIYNLLKINGRSELN